MSYGAVLVTGAAGFVGSHFVRASLDTGLRVVALDDLSTSSHWPNWPCEVTCVEGDVGDRGLVEQLMVDREISAIAHFAGRIRVDESIRDPGLYFDQNLGRTVALLEAATRVRRPLSFILSSSASVYGLSAESPISELSTTCPISPYGASKLAAETVVAAYGQVRGVRWAALRYFNVAGAHPDGTLRECHAPETHLIPLALEAARGTRPHLVVHGDDFPTRDGTTVRDYVHVMDIVDAHLAVLEVLDHGSTVGVLNLGSGQGTTVREVLAEVGTAVGRQVPHVFGPRREGDPPVVVASIGLATERLGWTPRRGLTEVVSDALRARRH